MRIQLNVAESKLGSLEFLMIIAQLKNFIGSNKLTRNKTENCTNRKYLSHQANKKRRVPHKKYSTLFTYLPLKQIIQLAWKSLFNEIMSKLISLYIDFNLLLQFYYILSSNDWKCHQKQSELFQ